MKWFKRVLSILVLVVAVIAYLNYPKLNIISGYASKNMASTRFIAGRDAISIRANDNNVPLIKLADTQVNESTVTATVFWVDGAKNSL